MNLNVFIILFASIIYLSSCKSISDRNHGLIDKIKEFKTKNGRYPENLSEVGESDMEFCYYLDENSFNLEYVIENDLYWYNSGNDFFDFLEGDAKKFHCK